MVQLMNIDKEGEFLHFQSKPENHLNFNFLCLSTNLNVSNLYFRSEQHLKGRKRLCTCLPKQIKYRFFFTNSSKRVNPDIASKR